MAMAFSHPHFCQFVIPNSNISASRNLQIPGRCRLRQPFDDMKMHVLSSKCGKRDSIGRKSEEEEAMDKCEEDSIAELLECLEKEAIMGDDEGKEPRDYNRRAQIFDKSSTVFQALKEKEKEKEKSETRNG